MTPRNGTNWTRLVDVPLTAFEPSSGKRLVLMLAAIILVSLLGLLREGRAQTPETDSRRAALLVRFELAANFSSGGERQRNEVLAMLDDRGKTSERETALVHSAFNVASDGRYGSLAAAETATTDAYILALRKSYGRYQGALSSGDKDWAAKELRAAQEYAKLAADTLVAEARQDDQDIARLQKMTFAERRPPTDQAAFVNGVGKSGWTPELRNLLQVSGVSEAEMTAFQQQVLKLPPERLGTSPLEMLSGISASRRELAEELNAFYQAAPDDVEPSRQSFVVGNPHDREETIDLFIRPISMPPDWKLSIVESEQQSAFKVKELDPGTHYAITLPAKAQVKVASVVFPVGEVGTNTTARWAVEGKIGNELIGGMVHEMNVPYIIPDLQLPPVGSKEVEEELPFPGRAWARIVAELTAAIIILGLLLFFFIFWRRRRRTDIPRTP